MSLDLSRNRTEPVVFLKTKTNLKNPFRTVEHFLTLTLTLAVKSLALTLLCLIPLMIMTELCFITFYYFCCNKLLFSSMLNVYV